MSLNMFPTLGAYLTQTQDSLTDNSGGTANTTLEDCNNAVTGADGVGSNAALKTDVDARLVSIAHNFADLAAQLAKVKTDVAAIITALNKANGA